MKIVYRLANAVPPVGPIVEYEESSEKKTFNIEIAKGQAIASVSKPVSGGGFEVDDETTPKLVETLDQDPRVYRAGGATPGTADNVRTD